MEKHKSKNRLRSKWSYIGTAAAAGALVLSACTSNSPEQNPNSSSQSIDLITDQVWSVGGVDYIPPTENTPATLKVQSMERAIVNQDGTFAENNPGINLYGTVLEHEDDFSVSISLDQQEGPAELMLYGQPPIIEDEFRSEQNTLRVVLDGDTLKASISSKDGGDNVENEEFATDGTSIDSIKIVSSDGKVSFLNDDTVLGTFDDDHDIFSAKRVWFGINALGAKNSFNVSSLSAQGENGGKVNVANTQKDVLPAPSNDGLAPFAEIRRPGFRFGAAVALGPMVADGRYREILFSNFTDFTLENAGKWQFIHPTPDKYDFTENDAIVDMAERSGADVHGHALIFGEANPQWLQDLAGNPAALKKAGTDHITTVMQHNKGKVKSYDVINEPLADYDTPEGEFGLRKNIWYEALGPDYIEIMLRAAHEADPDAELWINDFGMESDDERFEKMLALATRLVNAGVPLTGIGFQSHIDEWDTNDTDTHIDKNKLRSRIEALEALGLKVRFSEVDITNESEHAVPADILSACLGARACTGVTFWGVTDAYSSGGEQKGNGAYAAGYGLLWDENYMPTHAVRDLRKVLTP